MLETRAIVVQVNGQEALVEAVSSGGCGHCGKGCGSGKLSQLFCVKPRRFRVHNSAGARAGDEVLVSVQDGVLLRSALILYGLPLSLLFSGSLLGRYWTGGGDSGAIMGAAAGLLIGFMLAGFVAARQHARSVIRPVIVRAKVSSVS